MTDIVVVGAGHAGVQTCASLREAGFEGSIVLIDGQGHLPYHRPPLSKAALDIGDAAAPMPLRSPRFYESRAIELRLGDPVAQIDRPGRRVELASGATLEYGTLVLATGAASRQLPVCGGERSGILELRNWDDAQRLRTGLSGGEHVVIVGAGFIGLEIAAVARAAGRTVTVVERLERSLARAVSAPTAEYLTAVHRRRGVEILHATSVRAIERQGAADGWTVELDPGGRLEADLVLSAIGIVPEVRLAEEAGLAIQDGICVDATLRTEDPHVFAVGDCASVAGAGTERQRLESVQNATWHGRVAALAIAGEPRGPDEVAWFWSQQYDEKLQIAGVTAGHDRTTVRGDRDSGSFSVFCWSGERLLGAESINATRDHMAIRRLLAAGVSPSEAQARDPGFDLRSLRPGGLTSF